MNLSFPLTGATGQGAGSGSSTQEAEQPTGQHKLRKLWFKSSRYQVRDWEASNRIVCKIILLGLRGTGPDVRGELTQKQEVR